MMDYYLKAASRDALYTALQSAGIADKMGEDWYVFDGVNLDVIGTIMAPTGQLGEFDMPIMAPVPGFHANLRMEEEIPDPTHLPLIDPPETPHRGWACTTAVDPTPEYDPEFPVERSAPEGS